MLEIRDATPKDVETLLKMEQGVVDSERPYDSTLKDKGVKYYDINELISSENSSLKVVQINGTIIASGYAKIKESVHYVKHKNYSYLGFMFVDPDHRGKGVISLIIKELCDWSKSKGVSELRLDVYSGNAPAIRAYKKMKFEERMIEMRLDLNQ